MADEKVVWILGSGFSKPLDGPLLRDLFRQESEEDVLADFPERDYPDLARGLPWVQKCFQTGKDGGNTGARGRWNDAEGFLSYVDAEYRHAFPTPHRGILERLIDQAGRGLEPNKWMGKDPPRHDAHQAYISRMHAFFGREVKRALAAECHRFLIRKDPNTSDEFQPYKRWVVSLTPGVDTVITFNYDLAIERVARAHGLQHSVRVTSPVSEYEERAIPGPIVPVLKVHGSVNWRRSGDKIEEIPYDKVLTDPRAEIAIASPGASKEEMSQTHFKALWEQAVAAVSEATRVIVIGYSFPASDQGVQGRLLTALRDGGPDRRQVNIILGGDATTTKRVAFLMKSTANGRRILETEDPMNMAVTGGRVLNIVTSPLSAQEYIGSHSHVLSAYLDGRQADPPPSLLHEHTSSTGIRGPKDFQPPLSDKDETNLRNLLNYVEEWFGGGYRDELQLNTVEFSYMNGLKGNPIGEHVWARLQSVLREVGWNVSRTGALMLIKPP